MNLFPKINPYKKQFLKVDNNHELYIEQVGNPDGIPIIFLHGGPGSGCNENHRRYFNPNKYSAATKGVVLLASIKSNCFCNSIFMVG